MMTTRFIISILYLSLLTTLYLHIFVTIYLCDTSSQISAEYIVKVLQQQHILTTIRSVYVVVHYLLTADDWTDRRTALSSANHAKLRCAMQTASYKSV